MGAPKKRSPENKKKTIPIGKTIHLRNNENTAIAVIDKKIQEKFPRLVVLSTQILPIRNPKNHLEQIKDSEPKLLYDK
jgi:hypothetical protein